MAHLLFATFLFLSWLGPGKWFEKLRATFFSFLKGTFSGFLSHALFSPREPRRGEWELRISQSVKQETGLTVMSAGRGGRWSGVKK